MEMIQKENVSGIEKEESYSNAVRAGKRTYFFDVKATRGNELYITITESKKNTNADGQVYYEKHKLFLYREDFEKFANGLNEALDYAELNKKEIPLNKNSFSDIEFEDLGKN